MKSAAFLTFACMLSAQPQSASEITVHVSAQSNPYLAGMPDGARAHGGDKALSQSPAIVNLSLAAAVSVSFSATGWVSHMSGEFSLHSPTGQLIFTKLVACPPTCDSPDGAVFLRSDFQGKRSWWEPQFTSHDDGNRNGISNVTAPYDALIGVFLEDEEPQRFKAPTHLDFKRLGLNFTSLAPELRQVFFIGTGATKEGVARRYLVPKGATRLYLGIMDSAQWSNNSGSFAVTVKVERADISSRISYAEPICLPNRSQCTPETGRVEARGTGEYHIVLSARSEWGASIPTPPGSSVALRGVRGTVCLNSQGHGSEGCYGALGDGKPAGEGYLVPREAAGALVTKTADGRTYFSVNGRSGAPFQEHEAYFEFDATVR